MIFWILSIIGCTLTIIILIVFLIGLIGLINLLDEYTPWDFWQGIIPALLMILLVVFFSKYVISVHNDMINDKEIVTTVNELIKR